MSRRLDLHDRVALITGAGDGIGLATARGLVQRGARVAILDRDDEAAQAAAAELGPEHAMALSVDVTDRAAMAEAVSTVADRLGGLDVVVANAGITPPPATLRHIDPDDFDRVLAVNLTGVFNTVQPAVPELIERGGHVVVVSSCAAFSPPLGGAPYMISKSGVEVLARAFRLELAPHGVSVTTAYFGLVETALTRATLDEDPIGPQLERLMPAPFRRRISAEDAARAIVDAAEHRANAVVAPRVWHALALSRGVAMPLSERLLGSHRAVHRILADLEARFS